MWMTFLPWSRRQKSEPAPHNRQAHERSEGMEEAAGMMVGLVRDRICKGLTILERQPRDMERSSRIVED